MSSELKELRFQVEQLERLVSKKLARQAQYPIPGGGGMQIVRFTIISASCSAKTAVVQIDGRPCGKSKVTEETPSEQLNVKDPNGCYLDEPDADLIGRTGWAAWIEDDYTGDCNWDVFDVCCDPNVC